MNTNILPFILLLISLQTISQNNWQTYPYTPTGSVITFPNDDGKHNGWPRRAAACVRAPGRLLREHRGRELHAQKQRDRQTEHPHQRPPLAPRNLASGQRGHQEQFHQTAALRLHRKPA